jgi:hypothetical protein
LDNNGLLYQKDGNIIYVKETIINNNLIQDCILFKDKIIVNKFKNISLNNSLDYFTRLFDNKNLVINNNIISYFDKGFVDSKIKPSKVK